KILHEASKITDKDKVIFHHGAVNSALTDIGFELVNEHVTVEMFNIANAKFVLLGDIHKPNQTLQEYSEKGKKIKSLVKYSCKV
ncbi:hypothetical protein, partial [Helicobacter pylori]|uniref:hypothetical protein n=1 Tax=Helicobacter pylori TaxID=210 RepID=UPI002929D09A